MPVTMPTVEQVLELPGLMERVVPGEWQDLNGHVNVRHYLELFDLEHHLWYLSELHVGDTVSVHARFIARSVKRFHGVMFAVDRTRGRLASVFEYVSSGADLDSRRTAPLNAGLAAELDRQIAAHARLAWSAPVCGVMAA